VEIDVFCNIAVMAQINQGFLVITPPILWIIIALVFSGIEFLLPKAVPKRFRFVALSLGIACLLNAGILWIASGIFGFDWRNIMYEDAEWQIFYWMGIAFTMLIWVRPTFTHYHIKPVVSVASEGKTITEILPGETGRILYEGASWAATCQDREIKIDANQKVFVLRREGNTLIVLPEDLFHS
jgi:membrane protein implicated in regulation of membrane protease activity